MASQTSLRSKISLKSQMVLEDVAQKSTTKILKLQGEFDDETVRLSWNAFGLYCSRQLRMGRGVLVPRFGLFTFTAPEVKLEGVTNPQVRDLQPRSAVFIVAKDFVPARNVQSGIVGVDGQVRPYKACGTNGALTQTKINFSEIGLYSGVGKEASKLNIERVIKQLSEQASKGTIEMEIPNVGVLLLRNQIAGVRFNDYLLQQTRVIAKKPIDERKQRGNMTLTRETLQRLTSQVPNFDRYNDKPDDFFQIDENTMNTLKKDFGVLLSNQRAQSATNLYTKPLIKKRPLTTISRPMRLMKSEPFKQLTHWIRQKSYNSIDAFNVLLQYVRRINAISSDDLPIALEKAGVLMSSIQYTELFRLLDYNKDGWITQDDWVKVVSEEGNQYLNNVKSIIKFINLLLQVSIKQNKLSQEEVFKKMKIDCEIPILTILDLKEALANFDLDDQQALSVAKYLLQQSETITLEKFAQALECNEEIEFQSSEGIFDQQLLGRVKNFIDNQTNKKILSEQFQQLDLKNENVISQNAFKNAFLKLDIGLTLNEINKLCRQCPKDKNGLLFYQELLNSLYNTQSSVSVYFRDIAEFTTKVKEFMDLKKLNKAQDLLVKLGNQTSVQKFTTFLQQNAFPQATESELLPLVTIMDIDGDGIINVLDLETFLQRNGYILQLAKKMGKKNNVSMTASALEDRRLENDPLRHSLFPTDALDTKDLEQIMRELRQKLYLKKISNYEFFKLLDQNQDGFITVQEFHSELSKIISIPRSTIDGLFAYMDRHRIGMIDYQSLLDVMNQQNQITNSHLNLKPDDNWNWPGETLERIKRWARNERLRPEDVFRVLDRDFDGFVSKQDLEGFLLEVLKCVDKEVTQSRINRLFKLLDFFKRGQLQLIDIKRLLTAETTPIMQDITLTGGKSMVGKSAFDWKLNARQQIGIVISRLYSSIKQSYQSITQQGLRMTYKQFSNWIEQKRALIGFDLTDQLLQQLFSDLDPHKKGYFTLDDWVNAFSGYSWKEQMFKEVQVQIHESFDDIKSAFKHFTGGNSKLNFYNFEENINSLFPDRFSYTDIKTLWQRITDGAQTIDFNHFSIIFEPRSKNHKKPKTNQEVNENLCEQIVFKLRGLIKASNTSIHDVFMAFDQDGSGTISNLEFKNALRALNLGLTSKEIDMLLNFMDESGDGVINYLEFSKKLQPTLTTGLIQERCQTRLRVLSNHLHHYLLSPKDAFRSFDTARKGFITFEEFCKLINRVCQMSNETYPAFGILKDMFQVIDIRGDGVIDQKEWVQTFGQFDPPETIMKEQGEPRKSPTKQNFLTGSRAAAYFESTSKDFDKIMRILGRNRKYLSDVFFKISKTQPVTYEIAEDILENLFQSLGITIDKSCYPLLLRFAEKDGVIDYKFMLEVYKERSGRLDGHPNLE